MEIDEKTLISKRKIRVLILSLMNQSRTDLNGVAKKIQIDKKILNKWLNDDQEYFYISGNACGKIKAYWGLDVMEEITCRQDHSFDI